MTSFRLPLLGVALTSLFPSVAHATDIAGGQIINQTWTSAGNPYVIQGDITVPTGSFLKIEAGTEIQVSQTDLQGSGVDVADVEIRIEGTLEVNGTLTSPVWIHAQNSTSTTAWWGLVVEPNAQLVTFTGMQFENAQEGIRLEAAAAFDRCTLSRNGIQALLVDGGTVTLDRVAIEDTASFGLRTYAGSATGTNVILVDNGSHGVYAQGGSVDLHSCTIHSNGGRGVYGTSGTVVLVNSIVTQNSSYGVYRIGGSTSVSDSNVWGNSSGNFLGTVSQTNVLSANPQYVNPPSDLSLQATSVCIDSGTSVGAPANDFDNVARPQNGDLINAAEFDMGAYEYVAMPVCGDASLDPGETCDDGAANGSYGFCKSDCSGPGPFCGDGTTDGPEECDDGNTVGGDGCDAQCMNESTGSTTTTTTGGMTTTTTGAGGMTSTTTGAGGMTSTTGAGGMIGVGGSSSGTGMGGDVGPGSCVPGEQLACACPGGTQGVQVCNADGTGLEACQCGAVPGAPAAATEDSGGCAVSTPAGDDDLAPLVAVLGLGLLAARRRRR